MKQVTNLNDRTQYYASDELLTELKAKMKEGDCVINLAYTDYGGDFMDKVLIQYFTEKHPESILSESTIYYGQNALLFGEVAKEFWDCFQSYPLGYEDTEEYYFNKVNEQETEDFERFLKDIETYNGYSIKENALDYLCEHKGGYYNITTQGVDYSERDLIAFCEEAGIIEKIKEDA